MYSLGIHLYGLAIRLAAVFNEKARHWVNGRRHLFERLETDLQPFSSQKRIWIHAASLGEFEQGRPVIDAIKKRFPHYIIVLSFFSPSGYRIRHDSSNADIVCYLPLDTKQNARRFLDIVQPDIALFIKYEFWFHFFSALHARSIPLLVISAVFRRRQWFFNPLFPFARRLLKQVSHFFVQNKTSEELLQSIGLKNVTISGDTRFDRVVETARQFTSLLPIEQFIDKQRPVVVVGSSWLPDEELLARYAISHPKVQWIIAPHLVNESHLKKIETLFSGLKCVRYSVWQTTTMSDLKDLLIIDSIGLLNQIYRYAHIAYVGGGFGKGIHNILEAAVFGIPVLFGPRFQKFEEAKQLCHLGGAVSIHNYSDLEKQFNTWFSNDALYKQASQTAKHYVHSKTGATNIILNYIETLLNPYPNKSIISSRT